MISDRLRRALNEAAGLDADTCPCKREVVLVEALHGYAETFGHRMRPAFIEGDGAIAFAPLPSASAGPDHTRPAALPPGLAPLYDLLGEVHDSVASSGRIPAGDLEDALLAC